MFQVNFRPADIFDTDQPGDGESIRTQDGLTRFYNRYVFCQVQYVLFQYRIL